MNDGEKLVIKVTDADAYVSSRELSRREGIFAGSSSGAAFAASKKLALELQANGEIEKTVSEGRFINIVTVFPDRGDRYFSKKLYE